MCSCWGCWLNASRSGKNDTGSCIRIDLTILDPFRCQKHDWMLVKSAVQRKISSTDSSSISVLSTKCWIRQSQWDGRYGEVPPEAEVMAISPWHTDGFRSRHKQDCPPYSTLKRLSIPGGLDASFQEIWQQKPRLRYLSSTDCHKTIQHYVREHIVTSIACVSSHCRNISTSDHGIWQGTKSSNRSWLSQAYWSTQGPKTRQHSISCSLPWAGFGFERR